MTRRCRPDHFRVVIFRRLAHTVSIPLFPPPPPPPPAMPPFTASPPEHDENAPLLASPSLEAGTSRPPTPPPPWQFWNRPPFRRVHFADNDQLVPPASARSESEISAEASEGYASGPKYLRPRLQHEENMGQWMLYCLLILVGMFLGALFSRSWLREGDPRDMPMVPPVWTLPPVRVSVPFYAPSLTTASAHWSPQERCVPYQCYNGCRRF